MPPTPPLEPSAALAELRAMVLELGRDLAVPTLREVRALRAEVESLRSDIETVRTMLEALQAAVD